LALRNCSLVVTRSVFARVWRSEAAAFCDAEAANSAADNTVKMVLRMVISCFPRQLRESVLLGVVEM